MNKEELIKKHSLVNGNDWALIKQYFFNEVEALSASDIEPLELKGILRAVKIIDGWEDRYQYELQKEEQK